MKKTLYMYMAALLMSPGLFAMEAATLQAPATPPKRKAVEIEEPVKHLDYRVMQDFSNEISDTIEAAAKGKVAGIPFIKEAHNLMTQFLDKEALIEGPDTLKLGRSYGKSLHAKIKLLYKFVLKAYENELVDIREICTRRLSQADRERYNQRIEAAILAYEGIVNDLNSFNDTDLMAQLPALNRQLTHLTNR